MKYISPYISNRAEETGQISRNPIIDGKNLTLEEINEIEGFRSLRESWNELLKNSPDNNIFLTWEWLFTWWRHFGNNHELKILIVKESGKIIGIAPLMLSRYGKSIFTVNIIENICAVRWCDYSGFIVEKNRPQALDMLLGYLGNILKDNRYILRISNIPDHSGFLQLLRNKYDTISRSFKINETEMASCPYITLPATWEEYLRPLPKRRRWHIKQKKGKLRKNHTVDLVKNPGPDIRGQIAFLFELHRKRWQGSSVGNLFASQQMRDFYLDLSEACHQHNWLDFSFLHIDGQPISGCWAFVYNGIFYYHTIALDPSYYRYGAGTVHMLMLIEDAIQNGLKKFDMLKGAEEYKYRYAHGKTICFRFLMVKSSLAGKYRLVLLHVLNKLSNIKSRNLKENLQLALEKIKIGR